MPVGAVAPDAAPMVYHPRTPGKVFLFFSPCPALRKLEGKELMKKKPCGCKKQMKTKTVEKQPVKDFYITDHLQEVAIGVPVSIITVLILRKVFLLFGILE